MFTIPTLASNRQSKVTDAVTIANVERNHSQIASIAAPTMVVRLSPPYGKSFDHAADDEDLSITIDLCDSQQITNFKKLEAEIEKAARGAFKCDLPVKSIVRDGFAKLKVKKNVDVIDSNHNPITILGIGGGDKVVPIVRVSCLWKSDTAMRASLRVIRLMLVERAIPELPVFIEEQV